MGRQRLQRAGLQKQRKPRKVATLPPASVSAIGDTRLQTRNVSQATAWKPSKQVQWRQLCGSRGKGRIGSFEKILTVRLALAWDLRRKKEKRKTRARYSPEHPVSGLLLG